MSMAGHCEGAKLWVDSDSVCLDLDTDLSRTSLIKKYVMFDIARLHEDEHTMWNTSFGLIQRIDARQSTYLINDKNLIDIVACHLPRGSKLRWREDMGGGLPNAREPCIHALLNTDPYRKLAGVGRDNIYRILVWDDTINWILADLSRLNVQAETRWKMIFYQIFRECTSLLAW